jgi:hypothetical protein
MTIQELKPCPFCGGPAKIVDQASYNYRVNEGNWLHVGCDDETCVAYWQDSGLYASEAEAAKAWDRRTDNK